MEQSHHNIDKCLGRQGFCLGLVGLLFMKLFRLLAFLIAVLLVVPNISSADSACDNLLNRWATCSAKKKSKQTRFQRNQCKRTQQKIVSRRCDAQTTCEPSISVCGKLSTDTSAKLFSSQCDLLSQGAAPVPATECESISNEVCTLEYAPICGQPKWSCEDGLMCTMMMPMPKLYGNRCEMLRAGAYELPSSACDSPILL